MSSLCCRISTALTLIPCDNIRSRVWLMSGSWHVLSNSNRVKSVYNITIGSMHYVLKWQQPNIPDAVFLMLIYISFINFVLLCLIVLCLVVWYFITDCLLEFNNVWKLYFIFIFHSIFIYIFFICIVLAYHLKSLASKMLNLLANGDSSFSVSVRVEGLNWQFQPFVSSIRHKHLL